MLIVQYIKVKVTYKCHGNPYSEFVLCI